MTMNISEGGWHAVKPAVVAQTQSSTSGPIRDAEPVKPVSTWGSQPPAAAPSPKPSTPQSNPGVSLGLISDSSRPASLGFVEGYTLVKDFKNIDANKDGVLSRGEVDTAKTSSNPFTRFGAGALSGKFDTISQLDGKEGVSGKDISMAMPKLSSGKGDGKSSGSPKP